MTLVAGIDEAGLGPLLGPLVVASAAFEMAPELAGASLWEVLSEGVSARPERRGRRVCIADSKALYHGLGGHGGLAALERGVLAALAARGARPCTLGELLDAVAPGARAALTAIPWYAGELTLPCSCSSAEVETLGGRLATVMAGRGVRFVEVRAEIVPEGELNQLFATLDNKLDALFAVNARLLSLLCGFHRGPLAVHLDRHGGRRRYLEHLQGCFGERWIWVLDEGSRSSAYRVEDGARAIELDFTVGAERLHLAVALASMTAKYLRELIMIRFNRFWTNALPGLAPTAGYHGDGERFLADIEGAMARLGVAGADLARER